MKKIDLIIAILFTGIILLSFSTIQNNGVIGQTDTSGSPTSTPETTPETVPEVSPVPTSTSSTEGELPPTGSGEVTILSSSSSTGGATIVLNKNFTGIWKAKIERGGEVVTSSSTSSSGGTARSILAHIDAPVPGARIITFKLCVTEDGKLEGLVHQGGVLINGKIISQTPISENEVEFTAEAKDGKTAHIKLKLTGEREFIGTFADGHTFIGRKLNANRECLAPGKVPGKPGRPEGGLTGSGGPSMGRPGGNMFGGEDQGDNVTGGVIPGGNFTGSGGPSVGSPGMGVGVGGMSFPGMGGPGPNMFGGEDQGDNVTGGGKGGPGMGMFGGEDVGEFSGSGGPGMGVGIGGMDFPGMGESVPNMFGGEDVGEFSGSGGPGMGGPPMFGGEDQGDNVIDGMGGPGGMGGPPGPQ